ncbi:MAG: hypothetical protein KF810_05695 [Rhizobiaceae bacterium]|nr:hypothetical protein [Rhizobiaceae bacterium]
MVPAVVRSGYRQLSAVKEEYSGRESIGCGNSHSTAVGAIDFRRSFWFNDDRGQDNRLAL